LENITACVTLAAVVLEKKEAQILRMEAFYWRFVRVVEEGEFACAIS